MVGIDETTLSLILHPKARPPQDPATKKPVDRVEDRIEKLLEDLDADNERIVLPTPALCEFLVLAGKDGPAYLDKIRTMKTFLVKPFDEMAAIELAAIEYEARGKGSKRGGIIAPWTKVKFDRQIARGTRTSDLHNQFGSASRVFTGNVGLTAVLRQNSQRHIRLRGILRTHN